MQQYTLNALVKQEMWLQAVCQPVCGKQPIKASKR